MKGYSEIMDKTLNDDKTSRDKLFLQSKLIHSKYKLSHSKSNSNIVL